MEKEVELSM
jgi:hypothetical protein